MSVNYNGDMGGIRVYPQLQVAPATPPPSQFTADNNLAPQPGQPPIVDTTDYSRKQPDPPF
jgi:hypothetical protein